MDPTQCYLEMFDAMQDGDLATARERALDLRNWLERGGFYPPSFAETEVYDNLVAVLLRTSTLQHEEDNGG
jgi:hypothetical protein